MDASQPQNQELPLIPDDILNAAEERLRAGQAEREETKRKLRAGEYETIDTPERLRARVDRVLGDPSTIKELREQGVKIIESFGADGTPKPNEDLLERIINGENFLGVNFFDIGKRAARCVARLEIRTPDGRSGHGTGFLVSPRLLLTNHHVFETDEWARLSRAVFDHEDDIAGKPRPTVIFELDPDAFFLNDRGLDFTLVAVKQNSLQPAGVPLSNFGFNPLDPKLGKIAKGEALNIIQHPSGMHKQIVLQDNRLLDIPENPPDWLHYETDTLPGSSGAPLFNNRWEIVGLHHSGWAKRDENNNILTKDGKIWKKQMGELAIDWLGNEGIRISSIIAKTNSKKSELNADQIELLNELLTTAKTGTVVVPATTVTESKTESAPTSKTEPENSVKNQPSSATGSETDEVGKQSLFSGKNSEPKSDNSNLKTTMNDTTNAAKTDQSGMELTFTLPVQISVKIGSPIFNAPNDKFSAAANQRAIVSQTETEETDSLEVIRIDPDYTNRQGYDENFLGKAIPLPRLTEQQRDDASRNSLARTGEDDRLLPYHHFSLVMNRKRRMAFYTACNLDGERAVKVLRKEFKNDRDKWFRDPRIPELEQTAEKHYQHGKIDRGHLVRREDPNWGETYDIAKKANDDTFHFTNCTPQHSDFNQGKQRWQGIENFVLDGTKAARRRACVFTGPVLNDDDPELNGVQVPLAFWKIVVFLRHNDTVSASAYILEQTQSINDILEAAFEPQAVQYPIQEVIDRTNIDFSYLVAHDALNDGDDTSNEAGGLGINTPRRIVINSFDDIRL